MRDLPVKALAHELQHAWDDISGANMSITSHYDYSEKNARRTENIIATSLIGLAPRAYGIPDEHKNEDYMRSGAYPTNMPPPPPPWGISF